MVVSESDSGNEIGDDFPLSTGRKEFTDLIRDGIED